MDQSVVGSIVGAGVQVLLQSLISIASEEIRVICGFHNDLNKLRECLKMVQAYLNDAQRRQIGDESVKIWLNRLETVCYEADNVLDEYHYELLRRKVENKTHMGGKVSIFPLSLFHRLSFRQKMAHKIKEINLSLKEIRKEANGFGLQRGVLDVDATLPAGVEGRETDSLTLDPVFVGRENDASRIVEMLVNPSDEFVTVVPIVGMGGIGKTTLARSVFHNERVVKHFQKKIWVYVPRDFKVTTILRLILESLKQKSIPLESKEALLTDVQNELGGKRFLLVLDDVWHVHDIVWDSFQRSFVGAIRSKGNSIIVTTRIQQVPSTLASSNPISLQELSNDNCWSIIKERAFGGAVAQLDLVPIGRQIATKCRGLPLAASVIGGMLRNRGKNEWLSILNNELSNIDGDGNIIFQILKVSFDHLPDASLKKCFAYCSVFPKDFDIDREQLIELWMAEGLLQPDNRTDMEIRGNKIFKRLIEHSLLHDVEKDRYGNILFCKMHDLVHELACKVSDSESNYIQDDVADDIPQVQYLPLNSVGDGEGKISNKKARYLCTLQLTNKKLQDFKWLRILNLIRAYLDSLPDSIRELIHLRFIDVSCTCIKALPDSICKLYNLQTLRAKKCYSLEKLPNTMKHLISLRHLHISNVKLPPEIGKLIRLQTLPFFNVSQEKGCGIEELGYLKNLGGKLEINNLEQVHDESKAKAAELICKPKLLKLKLLWSNLRAADKKDENVLEGLLPHPNLKGLTVENFYGDKFPSWITKMMARNYTTGNMFRLDNLIKIKLAGCSRCEEIPMLGQLPLLKYLKLKGLTNLRSIGISFYGVEEYSASSSLTHVVQEKRVLFPELKHLTLEEMPNLVDWAEVEVTSTTSAAECGVVVFPSLEYLELQGCLKLMTAPSHFPCLKILKIDSMHSGVPFERICSSNLKTLTDLYLQSITEMTCLPAWLLQNNQDLVSLELRHCPNLTRLIPQFQGCGNSLRQLQIEYCEILSELADDLHVLQSLERLEIKFCPELKPISYPIGQQGLTSLQSLVISNCDGLTSIPSQMLESCMFLKNVSFSGCHNLSFPVDFKRFPSLSSLYIHQCPNLTS